MSLNPAPTPSVAPSAPRRAIPTAWFVVGLLIVAGIAVTGTAAYFELHPSASSTPHELTFTDDLGRTVSVPVDPARIVVLGPSIMDIVYRLGLRAHVVGVDCYTPADGGLSADYSSDQIALWNLSSSMCVQTEPSFAIEALLNLSPTLVLATTIVSIAAVEQISVTYGIPVLMLQPPTLSGIEIDVSMVGWIFGVNATANALNGQLQRELGNASAIDTNLTNSGAAFPTVLVTFDTDPNGYWTYGPGTFGESLIEVASATSISANSTFPYPELSGEQVLASNPQFLIYGTGFGLTEASYSTAPFWSSLTAVHNGTAIGMDSNYLTEPDPTMILVGLPQLIAIFHPGTPT
jgi:ABC-type Fe3+-hydroxamate transport system substrate-binding protein